MSDLSEFERTTFTNDGKTRDVFRTGTGPAVIVVAEMPGITPKVLDFALRVRDIGCTVAVPHLFGEPGKDPFAKGQLGALGYVVSSIAPACISKEFTVLATGATSPVIDWAPARSRKRCSRIPVSPKSPSSASPIP